MNRKHLTLALVASLILAGCDKLSTSSSCSSESAHILIKQKLVEQVEKKVSEEKYSNTGEFIFDKAKIRAALDQLQITVESVRTTKEDPNSSKKFCSAVLKVTVPSSMLADANQAKEFENKPDISQSARTYDIENTANVFSKKDFEYSVQPTDDGKELYVESEVTVWTAMLRDIVRSALLKPILEVQKANQLQQEQQEKQRVENLKREAEAERLEVEKLQAEQEKQAAENLKQELSSKQAATQSGQNIVVEQTASSYDNQHQTGYVCNVNPNGDNYLSLRTEPKSSSSEILRMTANTKFDVLDIRGSWYRIQLENGTTGWAFKKWICLL